MKTKLTLVLAAILTGTAFGSMPAAMPEFKNAKQLAEWRAEVTAQSVKETNSNQENAFYTGKPYVESSGGYAFKYRSYNPELARWTSEDPSGFPDGSNSNKYLCDPTTSIDPDGLAAMTVTTITDGSWVFSVNYKLQYDFYSTPTLIGDPWLTGITSLSGVPAGYSLSIGPGVLNGITSTVSGTTKTWSGDMLATVTLTATLGVKLGPLRIGPSLTDSVLVKSSWSVSAIE